MFGESRATVNHTNCHGGTVMRLSPAWPRTDLEALPTSTRTLLDTDGDLTADVVVTTRLRLVDLDGDGAISREADGLQLRPVAVELIQEHGVLLCGENERRQAVNRVAAAL